MSVYTAGMTGTQFLAALNRKQFYNALNYGVLADDSTDNAVALQALIEAVHLVGGTIYLPAGIYQTGTITTYENVQILGDGRRTVLKSRAAEILIQCNSTEVNIDATMGLQNLCLDGNNIGTIGYFNSRLNAFLFENLHIRYFTTCGMRCHGSLVGRFINCQFETNVIGIILEKDTDIADSAPNLLKFVGCDFYRNTSWGVYWTLGLLSSFDTCNFGANGTNGNANTGAIYYRNASGVGAKTQVGIIIRDSWFEANNGTIIILREPGTATQKVLNTIDGCLFIVNTAEYEISVTGETTENRLILRGSCLQGTASLLITGASGSVVNDLSVIAGTITQNNGGKYFTTDYTEVT